MRESRELPVGARQSEAEGELTLEQLTEGKRVIDRAVSVQTGSHRRRGKDISGSGTCLMRAWKTMK